jgi:hypothetical protein
MAPHKTSPKLILMLINVVIVSGVILGCLNNNVDKYPLFAIGGVILLVLNGMFFVIRTSESDLPRGRLKQMNKWVVWPIMLLAGLVLLIDFLSRKN